MIKKRKLIAEIGGNHEGDFAIAKELLFSALETNVDIVKFQIYTGDTLVNRKLSKERNEHFKRFELSIDNYLELAEITTSYGKEFNASIWDISLYHEFYKFLNFFKIGSGDFTNIHLIKQLSNYRKPFYLSTGLCSFQEVKEIVSIVKSLNSFYRECSSICLMQCTSMYPIAHSDANLSVLKSYRDLNVEIGYSDHTEDLEALVASYILGAETLEFHFTMEKLRNNKFRDHKVSLTKDDVSELVKRLNTVDMLLGDPVKRPTKIEIDNDHLVSFRRAVYFNRNMKKGEVVREIDLVFLRPCIGVPAIEYVKVVGKICLTHVAAFEPLDLGYFE